jgi:hypothetical protein
MAQVPHQWTNRLGFWYSHRSYGISEYPFQLAFQTIYLEKFYAN